MATYRRSRGLCSLILLALLMISLAHSHSGSLHRPLPGLHCNSIELCNKKLFSKALSLRGGVRKATLPEPDSEEDDGNSAPKKKNAIQLIKQSLLNLPPATRVLLLLFLSCNLIELVCSPFFDAKEVFVSDWRRTLLNLELWRPFSAAFYLGPISMHWATNVYFLIIYGSHLEAVNGTAEQTIFLVTAFLAVTFLGFLIGLPVVSTALISACVYGSSRVEPLVSVPFQFGLQLPRWLLPYGLAAVDFLQAGDIRAAIPHAMGILAGHFYTYNRNTVPLMGGKDWLRAPNWLKRRIDGEKTPNFMKKPDEKKSDSLAKKAKKT